MTHRRLATALVAAALVAGAPHPVAAQSPTPAASAKPTASASPKASPAEPTPVPTKAPTRADLAAAEARLTKLTKDIQAGESGAKRLQTQLRELSYEVSDEQGTLTEIGVNLDQTMRRIGRTKHKLEEVREKIRARARTLYKRGPTDLIGVLLGADSLRDFVGRFAFASALAQRDEELVLETRKHQSELQKIQEHQTQLREQQQATVETLKGRQDQLTDVFAKQQLVLARLAEARSEALEIVGRLEAVLGGLGAIKRVAGRGMTVSYGEWAEAFLKTIGAPVIRDNLVAVVAWEASEGTQATWNPLATTMPMEGATVYNSHGVRNYKSMKQGIDAVIKTLGRPNYGYEVILDRLERGVKAMETGKAINASHWCRGCTNGQYVIGIIPAVEKYYERYAE